ncbi:MAG: hypothetical protein A2W35_06620 [Chloroflexi bacterium RBG_16_57_11]|nr:MAG: hypothetical protein A2W35_06620 [Chloroflexi bacterium RBG_16_57_11]
MATHNPITIMAEDGPKMIKPSITTKYFAIHHPLQSGFRSWAITHIRTGYYLPAWYSTKRTALAVAEALEAQQHTPDWGRWNCGSLGRRPSKGIIAAMQMAFAKAMLLPKTGRT